MAEQQSSPESPEPGGEPPDLGLRDHLDRETASGLIDRAPRLQSGTLDPVLNDPEQRRRLRLPTDDATPMSVMIELNLLHPTGVPGAMERLRALVGQVLGGQPDRPSPVEMATNYMRALLSMSEVRRLVQLDRTDTLPRERAIYRVWLDHPVEPLMYRSVVTVKGDAAVRSFDATGGGIVWAVIDSGVYDRHPHFSTYDTLGGDIKELHKDFTGAGSPLTDAYGHGTHVAGIIAGRAPEQGPLRIYEQVVDEYGNESIEDRTDGVDRLRVAGVAPRAKIVSLKVLNDNGRGQSSQVIEALEYVRREINGNGKLLRIQGVNLSVGYEFLAEWFACGQSPLCVTVDRLVRSGVVVVAAAGNTGYGVLSSTERQTKTGLALTINDPGNAELAITVGATHREMPHTYGVSYFSSKGPTGDGRNKPDLVAPGERIASCAAGRRIDDITGHDLVADGAVYIDRSGTSMAAPHVSGAIAAFLSIRREYIGRPEEVKRVFLDSATSLGREHYFQGRGLVDLMRAIQSV